MISLVNLILESYTPQWVTQEEQQVLQRVGNWNFFKKDPKDPWEPSFFSQSLEDINISDINLSEKPSEDKLKKYGNFVEKTAKDKFDTDFPVAIKYKGKVYLLDGHHRVELAKRAGRSNIKIAVKDVTDKYN